MEDIITKRLKIRAFTINDYQELQQIIIDKEGSQYAFYDRPLPTDEEKVKKIAESFAKDSNIFAVCELEEMRLIGYVYLKGEKKDLLDLGFCFHSQYKGLGYATEACMAIIHYAFIKLQVDKLSSDTAALNYPSCKFLNRLGFYKQAEHTCSFRTTPSGEPIAFIGSTFLLEKERWLKISKKSSYPPIQ